MKLPLYQVDAFTSHRFHGNPAAVCPLSEWLEDSILQNIALENNLSETAFFVPQDDSFALRWFTPVIEVELCGHATLASAHVIYNHLGFQQLPIKFLSKSGELTVTRERERLSLNFPTSTLVKIDPPVEIVAALGRQPLEVYKSRDLLLLYESEAEILAIQPDFEILKHLDCLGIIITAPADEVDFVSRFFAPKVGINEDPVTGSAHTSLIPYWADKLGKTVLHAYQLSKRRGEIWGEYLGARVKISGQAVTYLVGEIEI